MRRPVVVPRRGAFLAARLRLRRRELLWWGTAIALAVVTVTSVAGALGRADAAADRWGPVRSVVVATEPIAIGQTVAAEHVTTAEWPTTLAPPDAVVGPAPGRVAVAMISPGEAVVESRLAPDGLQGAAALLPPGTRALAVPDLAGGIALRPGDRVDVLAVVDPFEVVVDRPPADRPAAEVVAAGATVVAVAEDSTTVAVALDQVADVAAALGQGAVTLALASPLEVSGGSMPRG